jgi:glycosyltransferase involved in cell wall biosynthesis
MKILYSAIDQRVPGTKGGSVHVRAVAEGLAALGHEVHVLVSPGDGSFPSGRVTWHELAPPLHRPQLRWARSGRVAGLVDTFRPDVVMERYYNFGGEALPHARRCGALAVLEVNSPVVDHPGSTKALLDRLLVVRPMRAWRERLCSTADLIVTPAAEILPPLTPREKIVEVEWGADTDRFTPRPAGVERRAPGGLSGTVAVFAGAFRNWHGAIHLARALKTLRRRGRGDIAGLFIGDGPELPRVRRELEGIDNAAAIGALPHEEMPRVLASADLGVAPFDLGQHRSLSLGFYWSPLKIFEYMAAGLPVVAPRVARIPQLVEHGDEGWLYDPADPDALADALERLSDEHVRSPLGVAARARAVREYSWKAHCETLVRRFTSARAPHA